MKGNATYTLRGPFIAEQVVDVQYSDMVPYIKLTCSKNEIAAKQEKQISWVFLTSLEKTDTLP